MRLYPKMILIIACTFFAVMSVLLVSFEYTVMDSFSSLEQNRITWSGTFSGQNTQF